MTPRRVLVLGNDPEESKQMAARLGALGYSATTPGDDSGSGSDASLFVSAAADRPQPTLDSAAGQPTHVSLRFSDRELRATVELALSRADARRLTGELEAFFSVAQDLFCFLNFNGYFKRLNPAWEWTLGFTREELMSRHFLEFVHPDDRERTLAKNAAVRAGGEAAGFENRYLCKDGSYRWLLWNATPFVADQLVYSVARDITVRKEAEAERTELIRRLETSLAEVKSLREILPICSYCRKIRDDEDYWHTVESYVSTHTASRFSHGVCPDCMHILERDLGAG